jgi:hypothetical protein
LLAYNFLQFGIPSLESTVGPVPMFIYIPHGDGNILARDPLLEVAIEK